MLTDFQKKKLGTWFRMCDADKNGVLERSDYEHMADRLVAANKLAADSPVAARIRGNYLEAWTRIEKLADADKDGKVTLAEFLAALGGLLSDKAVYKHLVTEQAAQIVEMTDHDRDGKITEKDFVANLVAYGQTEEPAHAAFKKLDRDGDGFLTKEELLASVEEFYFSEDPAARGNWLLGPIG
jgi:Ca2+-binding EF-hand superfamily protein